MDVAKAASFFSINTIPIEQCYGVNNLTKILSTLEEGTNIFIISHKGDILEDKFRSKIEFYKDRNFSKIR